MAIVYQEETGLFSLHTKESTYQMQIGEFGYLLHLYYGAKIEGEDLSYLCLSTARGFSGNPHEVGDRRSFSLDLLPQEYPSFGSGDYRESCLEAVHADGSRAADLRYRSHRISRGKPALEGLPSAHGSEQEVETLEIVLRDAVTAVEVSLYYAVFEELDVITRWAVVQNRTEETIRLERALSCCVDWNCPKPMDFITFYGKHAGERSVERTPLRHGKERVDSVRGASSHQQNPFVILCETGATEQSGECYGFSFLYSGNFMAQAERDQIEQTRLVMGIHPQAFSWELAPGGSFTTPEVAMAYHENGLAGLSHRLHRLIREHICRGEYQYKRRPVIINNWEATYFDFDEDKLVSIAREAAGLGVDMLVMDDGWFGKRDSDTSGLGDWFVNTGKLKGGLAPLCRRINELGMKFGLWFEPEMVSEDSDLYRTHPDWCLHIPGRKPVRSRFQLVLDMSRPDVREYLFQSISAILKSANIEYVKWDMNRHLNDVWSALLPAGRQGEAYHRHILGVYELLERLTAAFPHVLLEGCSGGGGRFDAGMLYYSPLIWCSDNTDAIDRIDIQYGTSFCYPMSAISAHVSACPNHQTGRSTPFHTRGVVALTGNFGYELDPGKLSKEEKEEIRRQTALYKKWYELLAWGDYYRLTNPFANREYAAWMTVSRDQREALVSFVQLRARANPPLTHIRLCGLDQNRIYRLSLDGTRHSGQALMKAGILIPFGQKEYEALQIEVTAEE